MKLAVWILGLTFAGLGTAQADLYRYLDKDGRITYSDVPPPADAKQVEKRKLADRVEEEDQLPYATQIAAKKYPVTLYSSDCGEPCAKAKALLAKRGIPYALRNPEASLQDAEALRKLVGALEVPTITIGKDKPFKGFEEGAWNSALDAAGYPQNNVGVKGNLVKQTPNTAAKQVPVPKETASNNQTKNAPAQGEAPKLAPQTSSPNQSEAGAAEGKTRSQAQ
jgi:glutaredoxin